MAHKVKKNNSGLLWLAALLFAFAGLAFQSLIAPALRQVIATAAGATTSPRLALTAAPASADDKTRRRPPVATTPAAPVGQGTRVPRSTLTPAPAEETSTPAPLPTRTLAPTDDRTTPVYLSTTTPAVPVSTAFADLYSPEALLVRLEDHTILLEQDSEAKIYPASLTKIMTAIVAIENLPDLQAEIELTQATFQGLSDADATLAGFQPGEQVRAIDLLYGLMLPSGAECAIALADQIAGSAPNFVQLMNQKAAALGMDQTHFENATGLHSAGHYTTVKDLALLLSYALQNGTFREIFTAARYSTPPTNLRPGGITFYSTMFQELANQTLSDGEILGGKTGYTAQAGLCLASLARVGEQEYILITAGAEGDHFSEQFNITDALAVYNGIEH